jgi:hypothetical protein
VPDETPAPRTGPVLAVFAHPDDAEIAAGGTLAKWCDAGREVHLLVLTNGDRGSSDPSRDRGEIAATRLAETEAGGRIMGLAATTCPWGTASWDVVGQVTDWNIVLETKTQDPRVSPQVVRWTGKRNAISLDVAEEASAAGCPAPRTATLNRK